MDKTVRKVVIFKGRVQGVNFRYNTRLLADGFQVAGYVKNLLDSTVELVAEGRKSEVDGFVESVKRRMRSYISGTDEAYTEPSGTCQGFEIAF